MSRTLLVRVSAGILFLLIAWVGYTQNKGGPPQLTINKVKEDLYEIEGDGGNVGVYVTSAGVILVDDKYEPDFEGIVAKVKSVTSQPIRYILSTHHHADHSGGNTKFSSVAEIISTANARANIVQHKQSNAPRWVGPTVRTLELHTSHASFAHDSNYGRWLLVVVDGFLDSDNVDHVQEAYQVEHG